MLTEPKIENWPERYYLAIGAKVNMNEIATVLPPLIPEVSAWLSQNNITPAGPVFFRYTSMENNELGAEVGFPVQKKEMGDGRIEGGSFPAGDYATISYFGNYKDIRQAHVTLDSWVKQNGWEEKGQAVGNRTGKGARTEFYITDPQQEKDPEKWRTDIAMLVSVDK